MSQWKWWKWEESVILTFYSFFTEKKKQNKKKKLFWKQIIFFSISTNTLKSQPTLVVVSCCFFVPFRSLSLKSYPLFLIWVLLSLVGLVAETCEQISWNPNKDKKRETLLLVYLVFCLILRNGFTGESLFLSLSVLFFTVVSPVFDCSGEVWKEIRSCCFSLELDYSCN